MRRDYRMNFCIHLNGHYLLKDVSTRYRFECLVPVGILYSDGTKNFINVIIRLHGHPNTGRLFEIEIYINIVLMKELVTQILHIACKQMDL